MKVTRIKVWKKHWNKFGTEVRVYIDMEGRRGGLFLTGNPYQNAGDIDGKLTESDIAEALELCGGKWETLYEEDVERRYWLREKQAETEVENKSETEVESENESETETENESETETETESEVKTETETETETEVADGDGHDFFDRFFCTRSHECIDCGSERDLVVISNDEGIYRCPSCYAKRQAEIRATVSDPRDRTEEAARGE